jgi:glycosyltransferase involved in cell wall biosynthesis
MKIGFDATVLHGRKSGVGYYCEELLKALLAIDHDNEYFVFSHQPVVFKSASSNGNVRFSSSRFFPIRAVYLHGLLPGLLENAQADLCHYTNFLAPLTDKRPYVVTIHDMGLNTLRHAHPLAKRIYTRRLIPSVARNARLVLTNSEFSKWEIVRHLGISEDRIRVTPLAASPEFAPRPGPGGKPYFLYVGNLEPRKNLERLIEAFARMPGKDHDLVIAGNSLYRAEGVSEKARETGLNGRVKFIGYVPREDLPELYSGATAFVYPSLLEGFGLPVVEAMACGTPVITTRGSSLIEVAGGAALLVGGLDVREMTEAMCRLAEDRSLRETLSRKGLKRSAEFSWQRTAELTLDAYLEAREPYPSGRGRRRERSERKPDRAPLVINGAGEGELIRAIRKTVAYSARFQYPLHASELRDRLFSVAVDSETFNRALNSIDYKPDSALLQLRAVREKISDETIRSLMPALRTLVSLPFVRMIALSGSAAHRNMTTAEDLDLFLIVEDGKVWSFFLVAMVWAKLKGLRKQLCMNYVLSDEALPLFEHDDFTAQQAASLKPMFGKAVYDRFIAANPFVRRCFPNFDASFHREFYDEISPPPARRLLEAALRYGPVQILERASRFVLGRYFQRKATRAAGGECEVVLDSRRLKLHLKSHKSSILQAEGR